MLYLENSTHAMYFSDFLDFTSFLRKIVVNRAPSCGTYRYKKDLWIGAVTDVHSINHMYAKILSIKSFENMLRKCEILLQSC